MIFFMGSLKLGCGKDLCLVRGGKGQISWNTINWIIILDVQRVGEVKELIIKWFPLITKEKYKL